MVFIIFILVVVGVLYAISGERAFRIPDDEYHRVVDNNEVCMGCHGHDKQYARKSNHPPKDNCIYCHKTKRYRKLN